MNTATDCRAVLGVDGNAGRAEIIVAYRKLAMRWHPDRNSAPQATVKFQQIQEAYRKLQAMHAPRRSQDLWDEAVYGSVFSSPTKNHSRYRPRSSDDIDDSAPENKNDSNNQYVDEYNDGFWHNFPLTSALSLLVGGIAFIAASSPGNWVLFSLAVIVANNVYITCGAVVALRLESAFRLAVRLYFVGVLAYLVLLMARAAIGI